MLHIIAGRNFDQTFIQRISAGDALIFIQNAVYSLVNTAQAAELMTQLNSSYALYTLQTDLEIRGLTAEKLSKSVDIIDYSGFVELTEQHEVIVTWS